MEEILIYLVTVQKIKIEVVTSNVARGQFQRFFMFVSEKKMICQPLDLTKNHENDILM